MMRRPVEGFRLQERLDGVHVAGAHGHARHVDAAVAHRHHGQVLLADRFAAGGELGDRAARRGFGCLAAGVRVDFGIEHQNVHVAAAGQHVVQAAVADVVGPAVAAQDPDALLDQRVGHRQQVARFAAASAGQFLAQDFRPGRAARRYRARWSDRLSESPRPARRPALRRAASPARARIGSARRPPAACPGRIRRCLQTANSTRSGRGPRR